MVFAGMVAAAAQVTIPRDDVRVGQETVASAETWRHPFPEILFVVDGDIDWTQGDERFDASAGSVVLVPEDTPHTLAPRGSATVAYFRWAPGGDVVDARVGRLVHGGTALVAAHGDGLGSARRCRHRLRHRRTTM